MLSARSLLLEMHADERAFQLLCSIAAKGEAQGGWENARIAALVPDHELAPKIARHGADEDKHARIFRALLHKRGLDEVPVPLATDYVGRLEHEGIGVAHQRLRQGQRLTDGDVLAYLAHGRVTEQRGAEQMRVMARVFADQPDMGRAMRMISGDEDNHLAYCNEELLRMTANGHGREVHALLRRTARVEIRVYRDVSLAVMSQMRVLLGWPAWKYLLLATGVRGVYAFERLGGHRRLTRLATPAKHNAMGGDGPVPEDTAPNDFG